MNIIEDDVETSLERKVTLLRIILKETTQHNRELSDRVEAQNRVIQNFTEELHETKNEMYIQQRVIEDLKQELIGFKNKKYVEDINLKEELEKLKREMYIEEQVVHDLNEELHQRDQVIDWFESDGRESNKDEMIRLLKEKDVENRLLIDRLMLQNIELENKIEDLHGNTELLSKEDDGLEVVGVIVRDICEGKQWVQNPVRK